MTAPEPVGTLTEADRDRLADCISRGFSYPERRVDDRFEIYSSAIEIADEIIAQWALGPVEPETQP